MKVSLDIPWNVPSKKNGYEVRFNRNFWNEISRIAVMFRKTKQRTYWIGPSKTVKDFEKNMSIYFAYACPDFGSRPVSVDIVTGQRNDVDNMPGAILDALQASGKIKNDRQVQVVIIRRVEGKKNTTIGIGTILERGS